MSVKVSERTPHAAAAAAHKITGILFTRHRRRNATEQDKKTRIFCAFGNRRGEISGQVESNLFSVIQEHKFQGVFTKP